MMKISPVFLLTLTLVACGEDTPMEIDVEITMSEGSTAPYMGKDRNFYRSSPDPFTAMRAWCKQNVDSIRTEAESRECATVNHVHASGGSTK